MGVLDRIQARIDIWRLERRYTRHRERRCTFVSNALYVDGEYVYQTPNTTGGSFTPHSSAGALSPDPFEDRALVAAGGRSSSPPPAAARMKLHRFSSVPGFGPPSPRDAVVAPPPPHWRSERSSYDSTGR